MTTILGGERPILFLGLADHWEHGPQPFPFGGIDLFKLARYKIHIVYPGVLNGNAWVFLVDAEFLKSGRANGMMVRITHDETGEQIGYMRIDQTEPLEGPPSESEAATRYAPKAVSGDPSTSQLGAYFILDDTPFVLLINVIDGVVQRPGRYGITATYGDVTQRIGMVEFHYRQAPALTPEQIKAIESNPGSAKAVRFALGCKYCDSKLKAYAGLKRAQGVETAEGWTWYADVPDEFACGCGKTRIPLRYLRESLHGFLMSGVDISTSGLSYVRQYGHAQVAAVAEEFVRLLDSGVAEAAVQTFIEKHPMLLARFHARRLFIKPNIVGRFQADFAILDTQRELCFIEIERPDLRLFRKNGHPSADLMHAYGQVNDWLRQYNKYPGAIQEALNLQPGDIVNVRGAVIAGRSASVTHEVLQRHYTSPPYPTVHFMTFDDLASSLLTLSKKLA